MYTFPTLTLKLELHVLCFFDVGLPCAQLVLDAAPMTRVDSLEMLRDSTTPGRGIERRGTLFRTNSIIDGNELEVIYYSLLKIGMYFRYERCT